MARAMGRSGKGRWITMGALLLAACGGSGSTGLISPEAALLTEVRETGDCVDAGGATYCPAVASFMADPGVPGPSRPPANGGGVLVFEFDTTGLEALTCALATRSPGENWRLGPTDVVGSDTAASSFAVLAPADFVVGRGALEAALLCFDAPPPPLPDSVGELADAAPRFVFVAPAL